MTWFNISPKPIVPPHTGAPDIIRHPDSHRLHPAHRAIRRLFPANVFVQRLLQRLESLNVRLGVSTEPEQWLYHPGYRTLWVWEPDLRTQPLSYLVVILAHEIGHVLDFDEKPHYRAVTRDLHWSQVPDEIECSAFVRGFQLLQELAVPMTLSQYLQMIERPMADQVHAWLTGRGFQPWTAPLMASVNMHAM